MIQADLHIHTQYSSDSTINPKTLVEQLNAHPTIKVIAITDHNTVEGYFKVRQLAEAYTDILIIPGVEITTSLGDLILLGVIEMPSQPQNINDVITFARERDAVIIVAHPYRAYGLGTAAKKYDVDAIETLNGCSPPQVNKLAENLAREMHLPGVAGTDAHNVEELWTVYNEIQAPLNTEAILKAIRGGMVKTSSTKKSIHF